MERRRGNKDRLRAVFALECPRPPLQDLTKEIVADERQKARTSEHRRRCGRVQASKPISPEPAPSHRPWASARARPRSEQECRLSTGKKKLRSRTATASRRAVPRCRSCGPRRLDGRNHVRPTPFPQLLRAFFHDWLVQQRNVSHHTPCCLIETVGGCSCGSCNANSRKSMVAPVEWTRRPFEWISLVLLVGLR